MKLTKKEAIAISLKKWKHLEVHTEDSDEHEDFCAKHNLDELKASCGLCEKYFVDRKDCGNCPIGKTEQNCFEPSSIYDRFLTATEEEQMQLATAMFTLLK